MKDPVLKELRTTRRLVKAVGGLRMIKGNKRPYFSLTMDSWTIERGRLIEDCFGAAHEELLKLWPELKPLVDLHCSDIHGVPMHASGNAFYWLAGCVKSIGLRVQYHGGSGSSAKSPEECFKILSEHLRLDAEATQKLADDALAVYMQTSAYSRIYENGGIEPVKKFLEGFCEAQKPRWKAEADKCRADFGLVVYGDPYTESTSD